MAINFDAEANESKLIQMARMDTYVNFRTTIPKPPGEDAHLRHILRFYVARALIKRGADEAYVLPEVSVDDEPVFIDVLAKTGDNLVAAICEPESVTPETEDTLAVLTKKAGIECVVIHSQFGDAGNLPQKFNDEIQANKIQIMAVVPPPFDDVYEYDIWMFETTFNQQYHGA